MGTVGLDGDGGHQYTLRHAEYQQYLDSLYQFIVVRSPDPSALPLTLSCPQPTIASGSDEGFVKFVTRYRLDPFPLVSELELLLTKHIVAQLIAGAVEGSVVAIDVSEEVKGEFSTFYLSLFASQTGWDINRYSVLVLNPSFARVQSQVAQSDQLDESQKLVAQSLIGYVWRFNGIKTSSWVSSENFAVIDVVAKSVFVGPPKSPNGIRTPESIPNLSKYASPLTKVQVLTFGKILWARAANTKGFASKAAG